MNELISVIVPIYEVEEYLEKCINSITNQTYKNLEIILVDDGSPDNCGNICEEYTKKDNRIKVIHKSNGGLSDARNVGIMHATGKYITFIDSDDYVDLDYVEYLYGLIKQYNTQMSICLHVAIYETGSKITKATKERIGLESEKVIERLLYDKGIDVSAWAKMYAKSLFENIEFPVGRLYEDSATTYKLIMKAKYVACGLESKYNYIIREKSITNYNFDIKKMDLIWATNQMCDDIDNTYPNLKEATIRRRTYAYLSTLTQLIKSDKKYPKEEKMMVNYINNNRWSVLKNKNAPMRDKIAIVCLMFGTGFFKIFWKCYSKLTGRE